MNLSPAATDYLLTLADDEHMIGARHTSWIGMGPFLEEDLAFCSIAQDELGHAIALYRLVSNDTSTTGVAVDALALGRSESDYRSSWLCEWPTDDWASALLRHWLYDLAEDLRWQNVAHSSISELADLVPGVQREEAFHRQHAASLLDRVLDDAGTDRRSERSSNAPSMNSPRSQTVSGPPRYWRRMPSPKVSLPSRSPNSPCGGTPPSKPSSPASACGPTSPPRPSPIAPRAASISPRSSSTSMLFAWRIPTPSGETFEVCRVRVLM